MMHGSFLEAVPEWVEVRPIPRPGDSGAKALAGSVTILDQFEQTRDSRIPITPMMLLSPLSRALVLCQ